MEYSEKTMDAAKGYLALSMFQDAWESLDDLPPERRAELEVLEIRLQILLALEKWESSLQLAKSLVTQFPERSDLWIIWAESARKSGDVKQARKILKNALRSHPGHVTIIYNLACYECLLGHAETAKAHLKLAFSLDPKMRAAALDDPDLEAIFGEAGGSSEGGDRAFDS